MWAADLQQHCLSFKIICLIYFDVYESYCLSVTVLDALLSRHMHKQS